MEAKKLALGGVVLALVLVAGVFLGRQLFPLTHKEANLPPAGNVLQAPAPQISPGNLLQAPGQQTEQPREPEKAPPADIIDYLKHLQRIEAQRQAMQRDLTPAFNAFVNAMAMRATIDEQEMQQRMGTVQQAPQGYAQRWTQLSHHFESKPAPPACQQLQASYRQMLAATITYMTKVYLALQQAETDPQAALQTLSQMQSTASADVDTQIMQANYELQQILDNYNLRNYFPGFVIKGDGGLSLRSILGG